MTPFGLWHVPLIYPGETSPADFDTTQHLERDYANLQFLSSTL